MSIFRDTERKRASFLMLLAMMMLVANASSSARFLSLPTFHDKFKNRSYNGGVIPSESLLLQQQKEAKVISIRGGADDGEENDENDDEVEIGEYEEDYDESSDGSDEVNDDSSDEDEYYDDETDKEDESELTSQLKNKGKSSETFVEPYFISPSLQMYTTFGTILLSRKIDMFKPSVVRLIRFVFIVYLVLQQAFIFYVRVMAKRNNDLTPVNVENPLTSMLSSRLEKQSSGTNDVVKNLASSFLKTESTIKEYDMGQAKNMQGAILFNIVFMWFLHFKMQQVQPLLVTTINGLLQLAYNPLFQVYVMGRNLERPFKSPEIFKDPRGEEESETTEATAQDEATDSNSGVDEIEDGSEEESNDESSDDEDEDDVDSDDSDDDEGESE